MTRNIKRSRSNSFWKLVQVLFWTFGVLSFVATVLSIVSLISDTISGWRWGEATTLIIDAWNNLLDGLFAVVIPLTPLLEWTLQQVARYLDLAAVPTLYPHWKHVFVLLMAVFGSYAKALIGEGRVPFAVYGSIVGTLFALIAGLCAGILPLDPENVAANVLLASGPSVLFFLAVYAIWLPVRDEPHESHTFAEFLIRGVVTASITSTVTFALMLFPSVRANVHAGLICLTGFAFVVASQRIYCGWEDATKKGVVSLGTLIAEPMTVRGLLIIGAFVGAGLFVVVDAATRFVQIAPSG